MHQSKYLPTGPWYHLALLFSRLGSIVLLSVLLFSQQIREDLVRAACGIRSSADTGPNGIL